MSETTPTIVRRGERFSAVCASGGSRCSGGPIQIVLPTGSSLGKKRRANLSLMIATGCELLLSCAVNARPFRSVTPNV